MGHLAVEGMDRMSTTPDCARCGHPSRRHDGGTRPWPCGASSCDCADYQRPSEEIEQEIEQVQPGDWHGWSGHYPDGSTSATLHIGPLPGRKSICMYKVDGSLLRVLAYFRDEQVARETLELISELITGRKPA